MDYVALIHLSVFGRMCVVLILYIFSHRFALTAFVIVIVTISNLIYHRV